MSQSTPTPVPGNPSPFDLLSSILHDAAAIQVQAINCATATDRKILDGLLARHILTCAAAYGRLFIDVEGGL